MNKRFGVIICVVMTALFGFAMVGCDDDNTNRAYRQCVDQPLAQSPNAYTCNDANGKVIYTCRQEVSGSVTYYVCRNANGVQTSSKCVSGCGSSSSSSNCSNTCTSCGPSCNCNCNNNTNNNNGENNGTNSSSKLEVWYADLPDNIEADQWWNFIDSSLRTFINCRPSNCSSSQFKFAGYGSSSGTIPSGEQAAFAVYDPDGKFSLDGGEIWGGFWALNKSSQNEVFDFGPNLSSISFPEQNVAPTTNYAYVVAAGNIAVTDSTVTTYSTHGAIAYNQLKPKSVALKTKPIIPPKGGLSYRSYKEFGLKSLDFLQGR